MAFKMLKLKGVNVQLGLLRLTENGIKNMVLHFRQFYSIPFLRLYERIKVGGEGRGMVKP